MLKNTLTVESVVRFTDFYFSSGIVRRFKGIVALKLDWGSMSHDIFQLRVHWRIFDVHVFEKARREHHRGSSQKCGTWST